MNAARLELLVAPRQAHRAQRAADRIIGGLLICTTLAVACSAVAARRALDRFEATRRANDERSTISRLWEVATSHAATADSAGGTTFGDQAAYARCTMFYGNNRGADDRIWIDEHCRRKYLSH